ncbi:hypothetical protein FOZ62_014154 [Perkinsus olseni]|uniref:FHA domain-containing protein n=1 Tax=Perkinsus olseni TaxID=32597 RepID=A0A7J6UHF5_PEROL|nr:hypothetical protein FOZ62_014154 [Perkinsus olseni]
MSKDPSARVGRWFRERIYWPRTSIGSVAEEGPVHAMGGYARRGSRTGEPEDEEMLQYPTSHSNLSSLNLGDAPSWYLEGAPPQPTEERAETQSGTERSTVRGGGKDGEAYCERALRAALGDPSNLAPLSPYLPQRAVSPLPLRPSSVGGTPASAVSQHSPGRVVVRRLIRHVSPLSVVRGSSVGTPASGSDQLLYRVSPLPVDVEGEGGLSYACVGARARSPSPLRRVVSVRGGSPQAAGMRLRSPERAPSSRSLDVSAGGEPGYSGPEERTGSRTIGSSLAAVEAVQWRYGSDSRDYDAAERDGVHGTKGGALGERPTVRDAASSTAASIGRSPHSYSNPYRRVLAEVPQELVGASEAELAKDRQQGRPPRATSAARLPREQWSGEEEEEGLDADRNSVDDVVEALQDEGEPETLEELPSTRQASPRQTGQRRESAESLVSNTLGSLSSSEPSILSAVGCGDRPARAVPVTTETQTDDLGGCRDDGGGVSPGEGVPARSPAVKAIGHSAPPPAHTPGRHEYKVCTAESVKSGARRTPIYATPGWDERTQELREKEARLELYLVESARRRELLMDSIKKRQVSSQQRGATARELDFGGGSCRGRDQERSATSSAAVHLYQRSISAPRSMHRRGGFRAALEPVTRDECQNRDPNVDDHRESRGRARVEAKRTASRSPVEEAGPSGGVYVAEGLPRQSAKRRRSSWHGDRHVEDGLRRLISTQSPWQLRPNDSEDWPLPGRSSGGPGKRRVEGPSRAATAEIGELHSVLSEVFWWPFALRRFGVCLTGTGPISFVYFLSSSSVWMDDPPTAEALLLVPLSTEGEGKSWLIRDAETRSIGRKAECDIVVNADAVSGHHCTVGLNLLSPYARQEQKFVITVRNIGRSATFVDGHRLEAAEEDSLGGVEKAVLPEIPRPAYSSASNAVDKALSPKQLSTAIRKEEEDRSIKLEATERSLRRARRQLQDYRRMMEKLERSNLKLKDGNDELTVRVRVLEAMAQTKEIAWLLSRKPQSFGAKTAPGWKLRLQGVGILSGRLPMRAMRQMLAKHSAAREANQVYGDCQTKNEDLPPQVAECRRPKDEGDASVPRDDEANKRARCYVVEVVDLRNA